MGDGVRSGACGLDVRRDLYFRTLDCVEVQRTFLRIPKLETAEKWRSEAPEGFVFTIKAWQGITHPPTSPTYREAHLNVPPESYGQYGEFSRTEEVMEGYGQLLEFARALESPLVLFQTPVSFLPSVENVERAVDFIGMASRDLRAAWEPRGWTHEDVRKVASRARFIHAVDPFLERPLTRKEIYFRLHGTPPGERRFYYNYTKRDIATIARSAGTRTGYVMFNNVTKFDDALAFLDHMRGRERVVSLKLRE